MVKNYIAIAQSIEKLFYPYAEVVIHDMHKQKIAYIGNNFSNRKKGDLSIIDDIALDKGQSLIGPYEKINFDGKKLKSMTTVLKGPDGKISYLLCVNFDLSMLLGITASIDAFVGKTGYDKKADVLFKDDWQEKINIFVHETLKSRGKTITNATKDEKKDLILQLQKEGAFKAKSSTTYAAKVLKISRASLYNYLKEVH